MQETQEMQVRSLGQKNPLEEGTATHSSILAWRIPRTEEPGRLQSMGSQRVGHVWSNLAYMHAHYIYYNWAWKYERYMPLTYWKLILFVCLCVCVYIAFLLVLRLTGKEIACNAGDAMENPMDRGAWQAIVLSQSQTRLKGLSTRTHVLYIYL